MKRKRKNPIPILLLWSKKEQLRFCNAVESIVSTSRDLAGALDRILGYETILAGRARKRKQPAASAKANGSAANIAASQLSAEELRARETFSDEQLRPVQAAAKEVES